MPNFVQLLTAILCLSALTRAGADGVAFDSTRIQLNVASNVSERLRARLADPETSAKDRIGVQRKLDVVDAQIAELSRRLNEAKPTPGARTGGGSRSAFTQSTYTYSTYTRSAPPPPPRPTPPPEMRLYILSRGLTGIRTLTSVHIVHAEGGQTTVADALSDRLQANDTIRTVRSSEVLRGTLKDSFEDVLITTGIFGKKEREVTVLDLVGDYAIVADGWDFYRTDTIRTVKISSLERAGRIDQALDCKLMLAAP